MIIEIIATMMGLSLCAGGYTIARYKNREKKIPFALPDIHSQLSTLQAKISWCRYLENIEDYGTILSDHYRTIINLHDTMQTLLKQKFHVQEITFTRYQQTLTLTYDLLVDNFTNLIPLLETLDHIKVSEQGENSQLRNKIENIFELIAQLLKKLHELVVNLSQIKNISGPDQTTTDYLLENLNALIQRAKIY